MNFKRNIISSRISFQLATSISLSIIMFHCSTKYEVGDSLNPENENIASIIKAHGVRSKSTYEISPLFNKRKLRSIHFYNDEGLCTLLVTPDYYYTKVDTTGMNGKYTPIFMFNGFTVKGDIPNGNIDSLFFVYDKNQRLIKSVLKGLDRINGYGLATYVHEYSYDDHNNVIKSCEIYETSANRCVYTKFKYSDNVKILTKTVSGNLWKSEETFQYKYNRNGQLEFDGVYNYRYYDNGLLQSKFELSSTDTTIGEQKQFVYDKNGNLEKSVIVTGTYDTMLFYMMYDDKNLLIEKRGVGEDRSFYKLQGEGIYEDKIYKYEYQYY